MVAFAIKDFGGEIPRKDSRLLPDNNGEQVWNCDLSSGALAGLPTPVPVVTLPAGTQRAYRYPSPTVGGPDAWLPLPSPFSSVVRSPLADDTLQRVFWTNPDGGGAFWNTYTRIAAGNTGANAPYNLGMVGPSPSATVTVVVTGGTRDGSIPFIDRSYCYTFVDQYGAESSPSGPSLIVSGPPDGTWTISGLPTALPSNPPYVNYPTITQLRLYRTITGQNTGAAFYLVQTWTFPAWPAGGSYVDTLLDEYAALNNQLASASWNRDATGIVGPPAGLDGLTSMPGGMLVGFTGNTVHFCEPNQPHAWPAAYDESVIYNIVALAVWQQSLVILTEGYPATGSGATPANFVISQVQVAEPCVARGSVVVDLLGVYYASQNGLVELTYFGLINQTLQLVTKYEWMAEFLAASIIACRHRSQYLAINGTGSGFLIDYTEPRMGIVHTNVFAEVSSIWNDIYTGDAYICANGEIYLWDSPTANPLVYRWRSKQFYLPAPGNFGAAQISLSDAIFNPPALPNTPLSNEAASFGLPPGYNAVFNVYAHTKLVFSMPLTEPRSIFRLPSGFKAFDWQFEIISLVGVKSIEIATTMHELKGV